KHIVAGSSFILRWSHPIALKVAKESRIVFLSNQGTSHNEEIRMQFGRCFEEFEIGVIYKHWPGRTITEYDDTLFCMLTMNHHPLHIDANYAENTQFKQRVVVYEQY